MSMRAVCTSCLASGGCFGVAFLATPILQRLRLLKRMLLALDSCENMFASLLRCFHTPCVSVYTCSNVSKTATNPAPSRRDSYTTIRPVKRPRPTLMRVPRL